MSGWANYFTIGQVSPAYEAVDAHSTRRLRQWLRRKRKVKKRNYVPFFNTRLYHSLRRLSSMPRYLPCAKA